MATHRHQCERINTLIRSHDARTEAAHTSAGPTQFATDLRHRELMGTPMPADETLRGSADGPPMHGEPSRVSPLTTALSETARHRVLSSERRRHVLAVVESRQSPVSLAALTAAVVAREDGATPADDTAREHVCISLHHVHLPMLDQHDVLEYDVDANLVRA